jgi:hypothetical protein
MALLAIAALLLAGGGWMWLNDASAASIGIPGVPQGTTVTCNGNRDHNITVNNGTPVDASTQGAIQALVGATTLTSDGRQATQLTVRDTHTEGFVEGVGNLVITLDTSRQSPSSSLTANQTGSLYPATQVMRFFPVFILNDETFTSTTPVQVVNSNVTSFPPKPGTVYVLTNSMVLRSAAGNTISLKPGKAFTIS